MMDDALLTLPGPIRYTEYVSHSCLILLRVTHILAQQEWGSVPYLTQESSFRR
jgi:hypothetical protein